MDMVSKTFGTAIKDAAGSLGVSVSTLKSFCRLNGISRWPYRKIRRIEKMQENIEVNFIKLICDFIYIDCHIFVCVVFVMLIEYFFYLWCVVYIIFLFCLEI